MHNNYSTATGSRECRSHILRTKSNGDWLLIDAWPFQGSASRTCTQAQDKVKDSYIYPLKATVHTRTRPIYYDAI